MSVDGFPDEILRHGAAQVSGLERSSPENLQSPPIRLDEGGAEILKPVLLAQLSDQRRDFSQMASRQSREQVVFDLELESSMEPVHPRGAFDINSASCLLLEPVIPGGLAHIDVPREMVQRELHMLESRHREADEHKQSPLAPIGETG